MIWVGICALAAWRVTALLAYEEGPFRLLTKLRKTLAYLGLHRLATCFHCIAFWVSIGIVVSMFEWSWGMPVMILAIAGAVSIVERWLGGTSTDQKEP